MPHVRRWSTWNGSVGMSRYAISLLVAGALSVGVAGRETPSPYPAPKAAVPWKAPHEPVAARAVSPIPAPTRSSRSSACAATTNGGASRTSSSRASTSPTPRATLLDKTMVMYGSAMADSNLHNHTRSALPGRGRGRAPGRRAAHPCASGHADGERHAEPASQARRGGHRQVREQHGALCDLGGPGPNGVLGLSGRLEMTARPIRDRFADRFCHESGTKSVTNGGKRAVGRCRPWSAALTGGRTRAGRPRNRRAGRITGRGRGRARRPGGGAHPPQARGRRQHRAERRDDGASLGRHPRRRRDRAHAPVRRRDRAGHDLVHDRQAPAGANPSPSDDGAGPLFATLNIEWSLRTWYPQPQSFRQQKTR